MPRSQEELLQLIAPGTLFRAAIDNVLSAGTGGLLVVGLSPQGRKLIHGGFRINCNFSPSHLYELTKMDGAIVLSDDLKTILLANAELTPDASIPTRETGIRHRSAERFAQETGDLVIAISQRRKVVTLYQGKFRYILRDIPTTFNKANQLLQRMEKCKVQFDNELDKLTRLEMQRSATLYDVLQVLSLALVILQLKHALQRFVYELGHEGVLLDTQAQELDIERQCLLLLKDYMHPESPHTYHELFRQLQEMANTDVNSLPKDAALLKLLSLPTQLHLHEQTVVPRGYRALDEIHRLPSTVIDNVIKAIGDLNAILDVPYERLDEVEGVGEVRGHKIKTWLEANKRKRFLPDLRAWDALP